MYKNLSVLVTVCARGGSKGVKNKNIYRINGKPLIAYTAEYAFKQEFVDDVILSTDSEEIKTIGEKIGLWAPFLRKDNLGGDFVHKIDVIKDALLMAEKEKNKHYDIVVDLSVTAPIRRNGDLEKGIETLLKGDYDIVFSVVPSKRNPYFAQIEMLNGEVVKVRDNGNISARQLLPKVYDLNGSIYIWRRKHLLNSSSVMDGKVGIFEMDEMSWYDVDTELDMKVVEFLLKEV